jgi:hypothetical protein
MYDIYTILQKKIQQLVKNYQERISEAQLYLIKQKFRLKVILYNPAIFSW